MKKANSNTRSNLGRGDNIQNYRDDDGGGGGSKWLSVENARTTRPLFGATSGKCVPATSGKGALVTSGKGVQATSGKGSSVASGNGGPAAIRRRSSARLSASIPIASSIDSEKVTTCDRKRRSMDKDDDDGLTHNHDAVIISGRRDGDAEPDDYFDERLDGPTPEKRLRCSAAFKSRVSSGGSTTDENAALNAPVPSTPEMVDKNVMCDGI